MSVRLTKVSKKFAQQDGSEIAVLDNISLELPPGTVVSLLGASGCGKTTLLKIVAGLMPLDSGEIVAAFERPGPALGFLQQGERPLPWRSVRDNISLGAELIGVPRFDPDELVRTVGLESFATSFPAELSGGMTQRMMLARTLATSPKLLLLDEPLGQLDIVGRKALAKIIRDYVDQNKASAMLVTHSVEEAVFVSDIVITLSRRPACIIETFTLKETQGRSFDLVPQSLLSALQQ